MRFTWQDVAGDLPEPDIPLPMAGWRTRFFSAALVLRTAAERRRLACAVHRLREEGGGIVSLRGPDGRQVSCRLVGMAGTRRVLLDFEVVDQAPA